MTVSDIRSQSDSDENEATRRALISLACVTEPGQVGLWEAIDRLGAAEVVRRLLRGVPVTELRHCYDIGERLSGLDVDDQIRRTRDLGARTIIPGDMEWPGRLNDLGPQKPLALWCWGEASLRLHSLRSVAVVGARACSGYGAFVAREWSAHLASAGIAIVSGGALGVDAAAHRGALSVNGVTICVCAGGVDVTYPRGNAALLTDIVERGLLVSEMPMGTPVRGFRFLQRNRLIAALASVTCVVEAGSRSGASSTARQAAELHRPVLAVPGPVTSVVSHGTHTLIQNQIAVLARQPEDIADMVGEIGR